MTRITVLLVLCAGALFWDMALLRTMAGELQMNDFGKFYYSSRAFLDGQDMYSPSPATNVIANGETSVRFLNVNPPHFHLLVLPLARLSPQRAVAVWMGTSLLALIATLLLVSREIHASWTPTRLLLGAFATLAFAGTQAFFVTGQLVMLLLLALTVCWRHARHGRWNQASVWLGICLSIKPFLLIFVPYLLWTGRWRACLIALAAAAACGAVGVVVFGSGAYESWYRTLGQSNTWAWAAMNASAFGLFSRAFDQSPYFTPLAHAPRLVPWWLVVAAAIGLVTLFSVVKDKSPHAVDRAFARLLVASQLMSPLGWIYYLWLPVGPTAALMCSADSDRLSATRRRQALAVIAIAGFVCPIAYLVLFQPNGWVTVTYGSAYFWATLAAWIWLLLDRSAAAAPAQAIQTDAFSQSAYRSSVQSR